MADLSSADRNAINLKMRQTPWYQGYFRARGLNPNQVKLSDRQRSELAALAAQNGMPLSSGSHIDSAGNVNISHGFAGLPTWAKIAIVGGAAATGLGFAGVGPLGGILGFGGSTAAPAAAASTIPTLTTIGGAPIVGVGATTAAAAPAAAIGGHTVGAALGLTGAGVSMRDIVKAAIPSAINGVTGAVTARAQSRAADRGLQAELDAQNHAAELQAQSAREQLDYLKETEAQRRKEFEATEARNFGIYQEGQQRLAPYRTMGVNALARFGKPITVGSAMGIA